MEPIKNLHQFHTVRGYQLLKQHKNQLTSCMEDYLEMIFRNTLIDGYVRMSSLSQLLNVQAPSASKMVQKLADLGLVHYQKYGIILLTENGKEIGKFLLHRHNIIETFLQYLGVEETLLIETELIEHNFSINTLQKIAAFNQTIAQNPDFILKYKEILDAFSENNP